MVAREWIESANLIPTGAKLSICVANETADISTGKWNTNNVVHHDSGNREAHIIVLREVVSKPPGTEFSKSRE